MKTQDTRFWLALCFLSVIALWSVREIFHLNRPLHRIHSLSRHVIIHQIDGPRVYRCLLNGLLVISLLCFTYEHSTCAWGFILIIMYAYILMELWFGYDGAKPIRPQMRARCHTLVTSVFFIALTAYVYTKRVRSKLLVAIVFCIAVMTLCCCYADTRSHYPMDTTPMMMGVLEIVLIAVLSYHYLMA